MSSPCRFSFLTDYTAMRIFRLCLGLGHNRRSFQVILIICMDARFTTRARSEQTHGSRILFWSRLRLLIEAIAFCPGPRQVLRLKCNPRDEKVLCDVAGTWGVYP